MSSPENLTNDFKSERKLSSESLYHILGKQALALQNQREAKIEQLLAYPGSYNEYQALDLPRRLKSAIDIFSREAPHYKARARSGSGQLPGGIHPMLHTFDILSLLDKETGSVTAGVGYDRGEWTNALNSTHIYKWPHLRIFIATEHKRDHLADLEMIQPEGGEYYFHVVGSEPKAKAIEATDPDHPLFQDVTKIVDMGVAALYQKKLNGEIAQIS